ncbi:MAG: hypothetical protein HYU77_06440 [Betaproteobacteria bacterium]|nr:hypothetical protein [Betaproteobacteria bacterium]
MFRPLAMQHAALWLVRESAPAAALALAECGVFNPDTSEQFKYDLPDLPEQHYREAFLAARNRMDKILAQCGRRPEFAPGAETRPVRLEELEQLNARLAEIWNMLFQAQEKLHRLEEEHGRITQLLQTLDLFSSLDLDLGALLSEHRFLDVRVGTAPSANLPRLREALELAGFLLTVFASSHGMEHCVTVGPSGAGPRINALLQTAGWHTVEVPPELRTHPETARAELVLRLAALEKESLAQRGALEGLQSAHWPELEAAEATLARAAPYASVIDSALRGHGGLVLMTGWVPKRDAERLRELLHGRIGRPFLLKLREPEPGERPRVPSVVRHPALLRSFAQLVRTYGVPRYGEIDPTWLFAVSFVLMFGMMFGDVGQGAVLAAIGFFLRGKLAAARVLMVSAGFCSAVFGFLYGSVFGYEHVFDALWISPLSDPLRVLAVALYWGIGFILVVSLIKTHNLYVEKGLAAALFDAGGAAGIALYLGAVLGIAGWLRDGGFGAGPAALAFLGVAGVLIYNWHEQKGPQMERILVSAVETLEAVIGFFANTLSFMRVGAFSLNHVALALAVFTVADMLGGAGHWAAVVVGNLLIMVLEGAIVAIQALRLEYYEGFSRFFSADGREFRPLQLREGK